MNIALMVISVGSLCFSLALLLRTTLLLRRHMVKNKHSHALPSLETMPTVSICIPARNETHAMTECLERVTASTYPKMEVIVLDDSSVDGTSFIIKAFAHAGVRFVEGTPLPEGWLGKAHAQHTLFREASGEYIFFMDVDTYISPQTVETLVERAQQDNAAMVSVLPYRNDSLRASVVCATLNHLSILLSHRRTRPSATSNAWLVKRAFLKEHFNGLEDLRTTVEPERVVAAVAQKDSAYDFFVSTPDIGISYQKKWLSQVDTSIRLLFPRLKGSLWRALLAMLGIGWLLFPFIASINIVAQPVNLFYATTLATSAVLIITYTVYTKATRRKGWLIGGVLFPVILFQELVLVLCSSIAYKSGTVRWKGRPVEMSARRVS